MYLSICIYYTYVYNYLLCVTKPVITGQAVPCIRKGVNML